ncbi:MAG TPA: hypothetical protein VGL58_18360 [Caulobacteraceae bacterium]|jgi:hypothetical protein
MTAFFTARSPDSAPVTESKVRADQVALDRKSLRESEAVTRNAYERGRRDERARLHGERRHHGAPLLTLILLVGAAAGAAAIWLGVSQGSFQRGGQVADQTVASATAPAAKAMQNAASSAGDALETAGAKLKGQNATEAPAPAPASQS